MQSKRKDEQTTGNGCPESRNIRTYLSDMKKEKKTYHVGLGTVGISKAVLTVLAGGTDYQCDTWPYITAADAVADLAASALVTISLAPLSASVRVVA